MENLPLIDVYPVVEKPHNQFSKIIAKFNKVSLPPLSRANTPLELTYLVAKNYNKNTLPNALHDALKKSKNYTACKKAMALLKDVPHISKYRKSYSKSNLLGVDSEIKKHGAYLSGGQVLFHGGTWPTQNHQQSTNSRFTLTKPLSTTLCPQVAAIHAISHCPWSIWVITVDIKSKIPAYIFSTKKGQRHHGEFEVLISMGVEIECTSSTQHGIFNILEVIIR